MYSKVDLQWEAQQALDSVWFVQRLEEVERTDITLSLRLYIHSNLFIQAFLGEQSGSLYFALIESGRRIFGIDQQAGNWHVHPYAAPTEHKLLSAGLEPQPLLRFLARVEELLLEHSLF